MRSRGVQVAEVSTATVFAVMLLAVVAPSASLLRLVAGLPLVFFLPGYALVSAFDPDRDLGGLERLTTAVALSISLTIGLGMLVALSPLPLSTGLCVLVLSAITLGGNALAIRRGAEQPSPDERPLISAADGRLLVPVAGSLVVIAIVVAATVGGAAFRPASGELVQLWMLPDGQPGGSGVEVGVAREISDARRFNLRSWEGSQDASDTTFGLDPGQSRTFRLQPLVVATGTVPPFRATLTGVDATMTVRSVTRWPR